MPNRNTFENGFFWNNYKSIESDFLEFINYVPYHKSNLKIYSPKLTGLLLQIGGYVDSAFKEMPRFFGFRSFKKVKGRVKRVKDIELVTDIIDAFCLFEIVYQLSQNNNGHLIAKLDFGDREMHPFSSFSSLDFERPDWWFAYNKVKHEYSLHTRKANLDNVLEGLSGAFLLNVVHYPSIKLLRELGYLSTGLKVEGGFQDMHFNEKLFDVYMETAMAELGRPKLAIKVETPLFLYVNEG